MRPKRPRTRACRPSPVQLPLFADTACLVRIRPALNEWRFYRMEVWPDLFGRALLMRQWGRIGTEGAPPWPNRHGQGRRGYQDRTP